MSIHVEWCDTTNAGPSFIEAGVFEDAYGSTNEEPALLFGFDSTFVIQGPVTELRKMLLRGLAVLPGADEFTAAYKAALKTANGDSNDREISAWHDAADVAAEMLGVNTDALEG